MKLFVHHTPEATPADALPDCAVVIDVLRATTTIAAALSAGAEAVRACSQIDELIAVSEEFPAAKRLRAGERGGRKIDGCDLGNSPLDCTSEVVSGKRLFLSTTNGTRALRRVEQANIVTTAAMTNRASCCQFLLEKQPETVWLVGSGWQGSYSLEDTVCAGAIAQVLQSKLPDADLIGNDETLGAIALYSQWENDLLALFRAASHGQRLLNLGLGGDADLEYCAQTDILDILPIQREPGLLVRQAA